MTKAKSWRFASHSRRIKAARIWRIEPLPQAGEACPFWLRIVLTPEAVRDGANGQNWTFLRPLSR